MKFIDIHFYNFSPKFKQPIMTPKTTMTQRKALVIGLVDEQGKEWFGEANVFETNWYYKETIIDVKHAISQWFCSIKNQTFTRFEEVIAWLDKLNDKPAARATLIMAIYPIFHTLPTFNVPTVQTINGDFNERVLNLNDTARLKLKWSSDILEQVHMIRTIYPDVPMSIDANQTLTEANIPTLNALGKEKIAYIEEPFEDLRLMGDKGMLPPIAIDESATSLERILQLIHTYPISVVVLKPFRLGGIDRALSAMTYLQDKGLKVVIGGMYETALSRYFTALISIHGDFAGDVTPHGYYFEHDLCETSGQLQQGELKFEPPQIDRQLLEPY
ncbi:o-succinylbenzoate synthase [Staphylococcus agnetis]|uniref:o-succinylbenzoate synthase n=1 Tax=Staphylococcus agnetis TaxID=985762 RepID=UPI000D1A0D64|nr:o-succinylbenzoate synthase [Staphylococcus agnetis]MCO4326443.1 o-succinylbenzoate synthase [Staphylococcus agnetis]MCO4357333.1 o-succinylbenzoate synthase [Staphylococcus agnetis]MCO4362553.1 o-succinylbenzoate synthase [Staphylococcus agnetis]MCO4369210.1 o-succinylbenzoate synthase [Staphylococcus agnetis]PTH32628.1 o-succinylbenzoate synthase [Staphylococcus agnetis]